MYAFFIGRRYLGSRLISLIAILGVALGVGLILIVTSVMSGFGVQFRSCIRGTTSHISITPLQLGEVIRNWEPMYRKVADVEGVKAVAPRLEWLVLYKGAEGYGWLVGMDPEYEKNVSELVRSVYPLGKADVKFQIAEGPQTYPGVYFGVDHPLKEGENPPTGEPCTLTSVREVKTDKYELVQKDFTSVGYYYSGFAEYDMNHLLVSLESAQAFLKEPGAITRLCIKVDDGIWQDSDKLEETKRRIAEAIYPFGLFNVMTWEDERRSFLRAVDVERRLNVILLFFIVGVAALLIFCFLIMMVSEKKKDIGILAALGATVRGIMGIFLLEGFAISFLGTLFGVAGGAVLACNLNPIADRIYAWTGWHPFPPDIYLLSQIPSDIDPVSIAFLGLTTIVGSTLFSLWPAWMAGRMDPVEALRYE